jgi:ABC-type antimicrobial peptide transport system permease subunit
MSLNLFLKFILVLTAGLLGALLVGLLAFATEPLYASLSPMTAKELIPLGFIAGIITGVVLIRRLSKG